MSSIIHLYLAKAEVFFGDSADSVFGSVPAPRVEDWLKAVMIGN